MNSVRAIMGATQVGGRNRRRYGGAMRSANYKFNCNCVDDQKGNPVGYAPMPNSKFNMGVMGNPGPQAQSSLLGSKPVLPFGPAPRPGFKSSSQKVSELASMTPSNKRMKQDGGARRRKARKANAEKYKKFLDGLDVKRLQKIAKTKGIKITKKKDGKTVYCKKATIVSKLFKFKYGK